MEHKAFESVLDNIKVGIAVANKEGRYIYVNAAYLKNYALDYNKIIGLDVHYFSEKKISSSCLFDIVMEEKKEVTQLQLLHFPGEGAAKEKILTASPLFNGAGEIEYVVYTDQLVGHLENMLRAVASDAYATDEINPKPMMGQSTLIYKSSAMDEIVRYASMIAETDSSVLLQGESGTGKEVLANYIHQHSKRAGKDMVVVNCASLPDGLLESELFGYEKGSFTGALSSGKAGIIETAHGSTLFFDEINSLPFSMQGKLLRVLETKKVKRIGSTKEKSVDFRLISATNANLAKNVERGDFRSDLYYRLNVTSLIIPPLRERKEDIGQICSYFMDELGHKYNRPRTLSRKALETVYEYPWPGNVRELRNFVERLIITSVNTRIIDEIPSFLFDSEVTTAAINTARAPIKAEPREEVSRIADALMKTGCNVTNAARVLGISRRGLQYQMKKHGISLTTKIIVNGETLHSVTE